MGNRVGTKGQVVISKATRDALGVRPGYEALEHLVGDHVELYFVPPPHQRSLKGRLSSAVRRKPRGSFSAARRKAWTRAAREKADDRGE